MCDRCGSFPAFARLISADGAVCRLCERCLRGSASAGPMRGRFDPARFLLYLAGPPRPVPAPLPQMPVDSACPACGLRYGEFAQRGLVGCGVCYETFAPAIRHALAALSGPPASIE